VCGSTTTAWRASWAAPPPTRSSFATCHCTSRTRPGRGSSTYRQTISTTGTTWAAPSWGTSRAHMCALGTPGTCARAPRSPASRSGTSYNTSPSVVLSSRAYTSPRSCMPSSRVRPPETSCASSAQPASRLQRAVRHRHQLCLRRGGGGGHLRRQERKARGRHARGG
jgi:hypothetical protein